MELLNVLITASVVVVIGYALICWRFGWPRPDAPDAHYFLPALFISIMLGVWGGREQWAGDMTDYLPLYAWFLLLPAYSVIQGVRVRRTLVAAAQGGAVGLAFILASLPFYSDPDCLSLALISGGEGAVLAGVSAFVSRLLARLTRRRSSNMGHQDAKEAQVIGTLDSTDLPMVFRGARDSAVRESALRLAAWGAANMALWFVLGREGRERGGGSIATMLLLYGGFVISAAMLAFAAFGAMRKRQTLTILLDGAALTIVGLWNIGHIFSLSGEVSSTAIWVMIGICQIGWGRGQLAKHSRIRSWQISETG